MKILISARGYDTLSGHEIGIFELDQAKALRDSGHDVRIAAIDTRSIRRVRPWGLRRYELDGLSVHYAAIPAGALPGKLYAAAEKYAGKTLWNDLRKDAWRPDIIHAHFGGGLLSCAKEENIPFVYTEHFSGANRPEVPEAELRREKALYPQVDRLLCVSAPLAENLYRHTGVRAQVVHNIVDTAAFAVPSVEKRTQHTFRFVSTGGLIGRKGFDLLFSAAAALRKEGYDFTLTVFGDGAEREALTALAVRLGISDRVELRGKQPRSVIAETYREADAFVLASRLETFGVVYIEAMAAGLPVIATRCGGPEDFVNEDNGLLVPTDDISALAAAMRDMMENRARYDSAAIAAETRRCFSPERIAAQLTEIYEEVTGC